MQEEDVDRQSGGWWLQVEILTDCKGCLPLVWVPEWYLVGRRRLAKAYPNG